MKYKKRIAKLKNRQDWWDKQIKVYQAATTRPGSLNK